MKHYLLVIVSFLKNIVLETTTTKTLNSFLKCAFKDLNSWTLFLVPFLSSNDFLTIYFVFFFSETDPFSLKIDFLTKLLRSHVSKRNQNKFFMHACMLHACAYVHMTWHACMYVRTRIVRTRERTYVPKCFTIRIYGFQEESGWRWWTASYSRLVECYACIKGAQL